MAGYSGDLVFNTIERIVNAIFPKVSVETTPSDDAKKRAAAKAGAGSAQSDQSDNASGQDGDGQAGGKQGDNQAGSGKN